MVSQMSNAHHYQSTIATAHAPFRHPFLQSEPIASLFFALLRLHYQTLPLLAPSLLVLFFFYSHSRSYFARPSTFQVSAPFGLSLSLSFPILRLHPCHAMPYMPCIVLNVVAFFLVPRICRYVYHSPSSSSIRPTSSSSPSLSDFFIANCQQYGRRCPTSCKSRVSQRPSHSTSLRASKPSSCCCCCCCCCNLHGVFTPALHTHASSWRAYNIFLFCHSGGASSPSTHMSLDSPFQLHFGVVRSKILPSSAYFCFAAAQCPFQLSTCFLLKLVSSSNPHWHFARYSS